MNFIVDVKHRLNVEKWNKTAHPFRVRIDGGGSGLYVDSADFGCSRTYATQDPRAAIARFLSEHACTAHNIREV
jgi:hypothetical protein